MFAESLSAGLQTILQKIAFLIAGKKKRFRQFFSAFSDDSYDSIDEEPDVAEALEDETAHLIQTGVQDEI